MNNCQFFGIDHSTDQKDLLTDQIIGVGVRDVCASKNGKERVFWRASPISYRMNLNQRKGLS